MIILGSHHPPFDDWLERGLIGTWTQEPTVGLRRGDSTYGHDLDALLTPPSMPDEPSDFDEFWADVAARSDELPPSLTIHSTSSAPGALARTHDLHTASFTSLEGFEVGCWILLPKHGEPERNLTFTHGYGGRYSPDVEPELVGERDAVILPCLRGLGELSTRPHIPIPGVEHVLQGIAHRNTYILRGCVADAWRASAELDHLVGQREHLYFGASFGGGIGALALQHHRYDRAGLHVPTFGHHPMRMQWPSVGSGAGLRRRYLDDPGILDVLAYFDAATAAKRVTTPTMVSVALWDPAVPPPGQFAVYHALAGEKELVVLDAAHTEFPGVLEQERRRRELMFAWLHGEPDLAS